MELLFLRAQYDPKAISLFTPSSSNVVKVTSKSNDEILVIGLKKDEVKKETPIICFPYVWAIVLVPASHEFKIFHLPEYCFSGSSSFCTSSGLLFSNWGRVWQR